MTDSTDPQSVVVPLACPRLVFGLDLSDRSVQVFALDTVTGDTVEDGKFAMKPAVFEARFRGYERARVVIEAGTHSPWIYELLRDLGHEVLVVNPRRLQLITESDKKSDRLDAQMLAQLGASAPQLLSPVWNRSREVRGHLTVIRARDLLVHTRTKLVNHVRSTVKTFGARIDACDTRIFHKRAGEDIPDVALPALKPILDVLEGLDSQIKAYDKLITELAKAEYPETALLQQVAGVGPVTSLAFVLTIGDPSRFENSKAVGSYLGLRPRQRDSGDDTPQLRITKGGNGYLRRLLVNSAHYVLGHFGPDSDLRRWGLGIAERGGKIAKKRAVVAVARKLAVLLHRLWVTGDKYEPLRLGTDVAAGVSTKNADVATGVSTKNIDVAAGAQLPPCKASSERPRPRQVDRPTKRPDGRGGMKNSDVATVASTTNRRTRANTRTPAPRASSTN